MIRRTSSDTIGSDLFGEAVDCLELCQRLPVGVPVSFGGQVSLTHKHDHPRYVEPARFHVWKIHLRGQRHRVVAIRGEVGRADVVVGIERDDALVDSAGARDQVRLGLCDVVVLAAGGAC